MKRVVGAAILRAGTVLAARRAGPPELAGRWELPGGKVEPGESPDDALVREIGEELGCTIEVLDWLDGEVPIGTSHVLTAATARITAGEPRPREHDEVRWLTADELGDVDWLEPDVPFVRQLARALRETRRAIFFEEDDARAVVAALADAGWAGDAVRERYHGEDDDEDHPWAVVTDAPELVLELLVDEYDGWLDAPDPGRSTSPPLDLPSAPRRIKRTE